MMNFVFGMMNFVLKMMNFVLNMMNFVLKMMNFSQAVPPTGDFLGNRRSNDPPSASPAKDHAQTSVRISQNKRTFFQTAQNNNNA